MQAFAQFEKRILLLWMWCHVFARCLCLCYKCSGSWHCELSLFYAVQLM